MSASAWLAGSFAVLMIMIAVLCATRLAVSPATGRNTERDADALHVLMGVVMVGMLEPRLTSRCSAPHEPPGRYIARTPADSNCATPALERGRDTRQPTRFAAWRMFLRLLSA